MAVTQSEGGNQYEGSEGLKALQNPKAKKPRRGSGADRSATLAFWAFVSPALLGLTVFTLIPIIWGFLLSLSHAQNTIHPGHFVGVRNYTDLMTDDAFLHSLGTVVVFALFIVPLTFAVSLGLALLVHQAGWGRGFFRTVFFIPSAVSYVVASLIWKISLYNGLSFGFINHLLLSLGIYPRADSLDRHGPPAVVLAGAGLGAAVALGRVLYDYLPGGFAGNPPFAL